MANGKKLEGGDVFIVDNSDQDWKVRRYLHDWADLTHQMDIATGYFEIGGLLALDGQWQKVDKFRILMGDEVSRRTARAFQDAVRTAQRTLDQSIEQEKETNDFLAGVPAIVDAIRGGKIECRVYAKDKFHAKAYITHGRHAVVGSAALVGSSNFTYPGISSNVELNVQLRAEVEQLQEWYERHWQDAKDVTPDILQIIERQIRDYLPFDVYVKALQEYCRGHEPTAAEWEQGGAERGSRMFPVLDHYQQEGYRALIQIARRFGGAFLCDGVGLGKTFVGLMLIERLIMHEGKRVVLFAPKTAVDDVWKPAIREYLSHVPGSALPPAAGEAVQVVVRLKGGDQRDLPLYHAAGATPQLSFQLEHREVYPSASEKLAPKARLSYEGDDAGKSAEDATIFEVPWRLKVIAKILTPNPDLYNSRVEQQLRYAAWALDSVTEAPDVAIGQSEKRWLLTPYAYAVTHRLHLADLPEIQRQPRLF